MCTKSIAGLIILFLIVGCSSSRITHSWKSETVSAKSYEKIMVIGIIKDHDRNMREKMENHLAEDLKARGYNAVSSLKEYGPKAFDNIDEEGALNKLSNSGVDAVITIVLLDAAGHPQPGTTTRAAGPSERACARTTSAASS